jgi:Tol biopolymer transport system component
VRTDVYVYDRVARTSTLVTPAVSGGGGSNNTPTRIHGFHPSDSNRLLFSSFASNLIPGDTNGAEDLFVRDLARRVTTRVATRVGQGGGPSGFVRWLGNGSRIAFVSTTGDYGVPDTNFLPDVYVLEVATRKFTLVSSEATGKAPANRESGRYLYPGGFSLYQLSASADGTRLAFGSYASDLGPKDSDRDLDHDVYIATLAAP